MLFAADLPEFVGRSTQERVRLCVFRRLREDGFVGSARVGPETFQALQDQLVERRDPTLRAVWDDDYRGCHLVLGVCGQGLKVFPDAKMAEGAVELDG